jgi:hypothetical protein
MSSDLRLEHYGLNETPDTFLKKSQSNLEKIQLILDSLEGSTAESARSVTYYTGSPATTYTPVIYSSVLTPWVEVSASYVISLADTIIRCNSTSGDITLTLPAPSVVLGKVFYIKKIDITTNDVIIDSGAYLIDGSATRSLTIRYQAVCVHSIGTTWEILAGFP